MRNIAAIGILWVISVGQCFPHSGGLDSRGGHNCSDSSKRKGSCSGYHYHRSTTPAPAPTPAPTVSLILANSQIVTGATTTATYASTNATSCNQGFGTTSGNFTVGPYTTTGTRTISITCTGSGGSKTQSSTLSVVAAPIPTPAPTPIPTQTPAYNRDDYLPSWADADGDCINTRHEVLIVESLIPPTMSSSGCTVVAGLWFDPYTDQHFTDPADLDVDHVVPLKEAHISGAAAWSTDQKRAFANDLTNPLILIAVDDGTNQSKGDRDPAQWMPPNRAYYCEYIMNWVAIKEAYGLTTDTNEQLAIDDILPPENAAAPSFLDGYRFAQPVPVKTANAAFGIGVSQNDSCGYADDARVSDEVTVTGVIRPEAGHIGAEVDIYFVDRVNLNFTMRTEEGVFVPWNGRVDDLLPVMRSVVLTESVTVTAFEGTLGIAGDHRMFLGYKINGELIYTPVPAHIDIAP